jgi:hypothetical protein
VNEHLLPALFNRLSNPKLSAITRDRSAAAFENTVALI